MTDHNREVAALGEYSDDAANDNGQTPTDGRSVASIAPSSVTAGATGAPVTVTGTGFVPATSIEFDGVEAATTFVSSTSIRATKVFSSVGSVKVTATGATGSATLTVAALAEGREAR